MWQACAALINLCAGESMTRRVNAANSGVLKAIVISIEANLEYPGIVEMAFVALQNICFGTECVQSVTQTLTREPSRFIYRF